MKRFKWNEARFAFTFNEKYRQANKNYKLSNKYYLNAYLEQHCVWYLCFFFLSLTWCCTLHPVCEQNEDLIPIQQLLLFTLSSYHSVIKSFIFPWFLLFCFILFYVVNGYNLVDGLKLH